MARVTNADGSRWYTWPEPDGKGTARYMSVTTIIDLGVPKPALIGWAARETATAAVDKLKTLQTMLTDYPPGLEGVELSTAITKARQDTIDWLKGAKNRMSREASLRGSEVHDAIEAYKLGRPFPGVREAVRPWYDGFTRLLEKERPIFLQTEASVYNRSRRYAGTLDTIGIWPTLAEARWPKWHKDAGEFCFPKPWKDERGPVLVADYKSGKGPKKGGVWPEVALQLSAYRRCEFIGGPEGAEWEMPETDGALAIHLQPGWYELVPIETSEQVFLHFLHAYETAIWQEEFGKTTIGLPITEVFDEKKLEEAKAKEPPAKKRPSRAKPKAEVKS